MTISLGKPMVDYITITSWDYPMISGFETYMRESEGEGEERNIMQYKGRAWGKGSKFIGHGEIDGRYHGMMRVSGSSSDSNRGLTTLRNELVNLTRIDLQITVSCGEINMVSVAGVMRGLESRKVGVTVSGERDGTIYIGSRKSEKFARIYIKFLSGGGLALRYEIEFKGKRANSLRSMLPVDSKEYDKVIAGVLYGELAKVRKTGIHEFDIAIQEMRDISDRVAMGEVAKPTVAKPESNTMLWLEGQVRQAVIRLANDHDTDKDRLKQWVMTVIGDIDSGNA